MLAQRAGVSRSWLYTQADLLAQIRQALLQHRVIFFRDQDITRAEHVAFARKFGELEDHPVVGSHPEHPGLVQIYKTPDSPIDRYENAWHSDASWREVPPFGCVLRCVECPPVGGDTTYGATTFTGTVTSACRCSITSNSPVRRSGPSPRMNNWPTGRRWTVRACAG